MLHNLLAISLSVFLLRFTSPFSVILISCWNPSTETSFSTVTNWRICNTFMPLTFLSVINNYVMAFVMNVCLLNLRIYCNAFNILAPVFGSCYLFMYIKIYLLKMYKCYKQSVLVSWLDAHPKLLISIGLYRSLPGLNPPDWIRSVYSTLQYYSL